VPVVAGLKIHMMMWSGWLYSIISHFIYAFSRFISCRKLLFKSPCFIGFSPATLSYMRKTLFLGFACLSLFACNGKKQDPSKQNTPAQTLVDVVIAGSRQLTNTIEANGSVVANEMVEIHPEISGRLTLLNVPDGAKVSAGTILAKINDADLQAQLGKSKVQLDLAQKTEERLRKLLAVSGANQADYDAALNNVNNIKADIDLLNAQIDKTVAKAPFGGVLGLRLVSPGAYVTPQTILATLQQVDKVKIDFTVPELYANLIHKGGTVQIVTNQKGQKRTATVIATEPDINTSTRNLKVRALLNGSSIDPGTFVKILFDAGGKTNFIVIPTNAIIPDADSKKVIVVKDGKGKMVPVETGVRSAGSVEITKGLSDGDSVVVTGVLFVRPNAPVKIRSVKNLEDMTKEQ
jgi:membrane fusion protein (multidrug efflux system)